MPRLAYTGHRRERRLQDWIKGWWVVSGIHSIEQLLLFDRLPSFCLGDILIALPSRYHDITKQTGKKFLVARITTHGGICYWGRPERTSPEKIGSGINARIVTDGFLDYCLDPLGDGQFFELYQPKEVSRVS